MIHTRLERSRLNVPAHRWRTTLKAVGSAADVAAPDLEDAVPADENVTARANVTMAQVALRHYAADRRTL